MAVEPPDAGAFDRPELQLSPEMHAAQAEMAAERGEAYDPETFEERVASAVATSLDRDGDTEPVPGQEERFEEWAGPLDEQDEA